MLPRGLVSRIMFPFPNPPTYNVDSFPHDLVWVPKTVGATERCDDSMQSAANEDCIPCLLLTYPSARFLILFFHANAEDLGRCHGFCSYVRDQFQVHVLAVEYPGYGICPGAPCSKSIMENALAAMSFVTDTLQWPLDSIKVFGRSIGTGPAVGLASLFNLAGAIFVTPFLSIQELFADRLGKLASVFIDDREWFNNVEKVPQITCPCMIIHGQRDELIACRHGESLYEAIRPRKLLISPPEMEHNTNLLTNLQFFVLPMFQFFALPDYAFQELQVPPWAYDKRRSPFYVRPGIEVSSSELPNNTGKKMEIPAGDNCVTDNSLGLRSDAKLIAKVSHASRKAMTAAGNRTNRQLAPLFSSKSFNDTPCFLDLDGLEHDRVEDESTISAKCREHCNPQARNGIRDGSAASLSPEAKEAIQKLEELAGKICSTEICSDELCVLEERKDDSPELRRQGKAKEKKNCASRGMNCGAAYKDGLRESSTLREPAGDLNASQSIWPPWCGKSLVHASEVDVQATMKRPQAPGLAPNDIIEAGALGDVHVKRSPSSGSKRKDDNAWDAWSAASSLPSESPLISPQPSPAVTAAFRLFDKESRQHSLGTASLAKSQRQGNDVVAKSAFFAACCKALPSGPILDPTSSSRCPPAAVYEEAPTMPCSPHATAEHERKVAANGSQLWRKYPLGTPPTSLALDTHDDTSLATSLAPVNDGVFRKGKKFSI